jgi:hypothetical protein
MHLSRTGKFIDEYNFCNSTAKYTKFSQNSDKNEEKVAKIDLLKSRKSCFQNNITGYSSDPRN